MTLVTFLLAVASIAQDSQVYMPLGDVSQKTTNIQIFCLSSPGEDNTPNRGHTELLTLWANPAEIEEMDEHEQQAANFWALIGLEYDPCEQSFVTMQKYDFTVLNIQTSTALLSKLIECAKDPNYSLETLQHVIQELQRFDIVINNIVVGTPPAAQLRPYIDEAPFHDALYNLTPQQEMRIGQLQDYLATYKETLTQKIHRILQTHSPQQEVR